MTGPHRNAFLVQKRGQIVRMNVLHVESNRPSTLRRVAVDRNSRNLPQAAHRIPAQPARVLPDPLHSHRSQVVNRRAQRHRLTDRRRARLELVRQLGMGRALLRYLPNHLAPTHVRRHRLQQLPPPPKPPDAVRPQQGVHLASFESEGRPPYNLLTVNLDPDVVQLEPVAQFLAWLGPVPRTFGRCLRHRLCLHRFCLRLARPRARSAS